MKKLLCAVFIFCFCFGGVSIIPFGVVSPAGGGGCPAGTEDFSAYTEVDTNSKITIDTNCKISWADLDTDEDGYVYVDKGAGHFSGDFTHQFEFMITAHAVSTKVTVYGVTNTLDDAGNWAATSTSIYVSDVSGVARLYLSTPGDSDVYTGGLVNDTLYYVTVTRDDDGGDGSGSVTAIICTGGYGCGSPVDTLSCTNLTSQEDYRYIYPMSSKNDASGGRNSTGYVQNLDINE